MSRNIKINRTYNTNLEKEKKQYTVNVTSPSTIDETTSGSFDISLQRKLSSDLDVFYDLPDEVFVNTKANYFLSVLRDVILATDLEDVTLSKLHVSEMTEESLMIEWIFNYFRTYFSFEKDNQDSYGMIENNPETQEFSNQFRPLKINEYEEVARSIVEYIVMMGGFR